MKRLSIILALMCATATHAQSLDPNKFYRLASVGLDGQSLDIVNNNGKHEFARIQPSGGQSGQQLRFTANGQWIKITTAFRGSKMCLDILNGGDADGAVWLAPCGNFSGQNWQFQSANGGLKLFTEFRGRKMCLDVIGGGRNIGYTRLEPCASAQRSQLWTLSPH